MSRLNGKVIVLTGAAGHIGSVGAQMLHDEGARLVLFDHSRDVEDVAARLNSATAGAVACIGDVTAEADVRRCISATLETFGRLDGLWNNAAALEFDFLSRDTTIAELELDYFERAISVNLLGAFLFCKYAIPEMRNAGGGSIVNTSSIGSTRGDTAWSAYGVSKAGLNRLGLDVATQYGGSNIRCNTVVVGSIPNPLRMDEITFGDHTMSEYQLINRPGRPADVGHAAVFLLSDESSFITGGSIRVDGGVNVFQPWVISRRRLQ